MTPAYLPPFVRAIPYIVGLTVAAAVLWRSYKTGKVGGQTSFQPTDRRTHPVPYWMGMVTGCALLLLALGWTAIHALQWLSSR